MLVVVVVENMQTADIDKHVEDCMDTDKEIGDMDLGQAVVVVVVDAHNLDEEEDHRGKGMACSYYTGSFPWIKHSIILYYPENIKDCT